MDIHGIGLSDAAVVVAGIKWDRKAGGAHYANDEVGVMIHWGRIYPHSRTGWWIEFDDEDIARPVSEPYKGMLEVKGLLTPADERALLASK